MELLQDLLTFENLFLAISALLAIVVSKTGIEFASDVKDIFDVLARTVSPESPKGRKLSDSELRAVKDEVFDLLYKLWKKYEGGAISKIGRFLSQLKFW